MKPVTASSASDQGNRVKDKIPTLVLRSRRRRRLEGRPQAEISAFSPVPSVETPASRAPQDEGDRVVFFTRLPCDSDEAAQNPPSGSGLLRCARNDGAGGAKS
jgi:hypothetical protein